MTDSKRSKLITVAQSHCMQDANLPPQVWRISDSCIAFPWSGTCYFIRAWSRLIALNPATYSRFLYLLASAPQFTSHTSPQWLYYHSEYTFHSSSAIAVHLTNQRSYGSHQRGRLMCRQQRDALLPKLCRGRLGSLHGSKMYGPLIDLYRVLR